MRVLGTAGHVDHGKSTLVRALTGIDPDRLAEEKRREMTIDLGFAWFDAPNGETIGIVDVPGHQDFIENMLAGIGGIDAVLFIIAADEGVMPQTREHLAIVNLLGIQHGIIVMTKCDMVQDDDWFSLVETEIRETVQHTALASAPLIRISAHTGMGLSSLNETIIQCLSALPPRPQNKVPRLPIDRVFTLSGFGTVVTGTLLDGQLRVGEEIQLQPSGLKAKIRGLHSYNRAADIAYVGSRVAVNLSGIEKNAVRRGEILTLPNHLSPTQRIDAYFEHLPDAPRPLKHHALIKLFCGTDEALGTVRLLGDEQLPIGASGWIQIELQKPMALAQEDKFILRYPSPPQTIGGGIVVNPHPTRRWKRFQSAIIQQLQAQKDGTPQSRLAKLAEKTDPTKREILRQASGMTDADFIRILQRALDEGLLVEISNGQFIATSTLYLLRQKMSQIITQFHADNPLKLGIPREELRSRLNIKQPLFSFLLMQSPDILSSETLLHHQTHQITFTDAESRLVNKLMMVMESQENLYTPPTTAEAIAMVGESIVRALIDLNQLVQVSDEIIFSHRAYTNLLHMALGIIEKEGQIDVKTLREQLNSTRKYLIPFFEYTDAQGLTKRIGDVRIKGDK